MSCPAVKHLKSVPVEFSVYRQILKHCQSVFEVKPQREREREGGGGGGGGEREGKGESGRQCERERGKERERESVGERESGREIV